MTLKSLFKKRSTASLKDFIKYARIIFNDHFTLLIFILLGAGGYAYSEYLKTVTSGLAGPRIFVAIIYFIIVTAGSVATLVERADQIYLLPKEIEFHPILKSMVLKSYLLSLLLLGAFTFITFPIFVATIDASIIDGLFLFLALAGIKWLNHLNKLYPFFYQVQKKQQLAGTAVMLGSFLSMIGLVFLSIKITAAVISILALASGYLFFTGKIYFNQLIKWETLIEAEEMRLHRLYRVIEMFIDVPNMETKVKRLSWLDRPLNWLSQKYPNAPYYYTLRTVTRNTEYSMLVLRVTLFGSVMLLATDSVLLSLLLMVLFLYMIGFQLISLAKEMERVPQFHIYPIQSETKIKATLFIVFQTLIIVSSVFTAVAVVNIGWMAILLLVGGVLFSYLFSNFYVPKRLRTI